MSLREARPGLHAAPKGLGFAWQPRRPAWTKIGSFGVGDEGLKSLRSFEEALGV